MCIFGFLVYGVNLVPSIRVSIFELNTYCACVGKLKGLFGGSGSGSASTTESESEFSEADKNNGSEADSGVANTTDTTAAEGGNVTNGDAPGNEKLWKTSAQNQKTSDTIRLEVEMKPLSMPPMTSTEIKEARRKCVFRFYDTIY